MTDRESATPRSLPQRCQHCNKQRFVPVDLDSWDCQRCGFHNESIWEVKWGFQSSSPLFGAMVVPVVKVIEDEHGDDRIGS